MHRGIGIFLINTPGTYIPGEIPIVKLNLAGNCILPMLIQNDKDFLSVGLDPLLEKFQLHGP